VEKTFWQHEINKNIRETVSLIMMNFDINSFAHSNNSLSYDYVCLCELCFSAFLLCL